MSGANVWWLAGIVFAVIVIGVIGALNRSPVRWPGSPPDKLSDGGKNASSELPVRNDASFKRRLDDAVRTRGRRRS